MVNNVFYIGQYSEGATSKMRGEYLRELIQPNLFKVINIDIPQLGVNRIVRSIGWRFKMGPLISKINKYVEKELQASQPNDLIWVDKGVFLDPDLLLQLKVDKKFLVHYTPDTAFYFNRSDLFRKALPYYNFCITTKSFEVEEYKRSGSQNVLQATQGYDPSIHRPCYSFNEKSGVVFIGHHEDNREELIAMLLERKVEVKLAGANWSRFANKKKNNHYLVYLGKSVYGHNYAKEISGSLMGLGLLSKIFPEKHTTRTFEIPACGTALITERNDEIESFYSDDEVIFFNSPTEFLEKIEFGLRNLSYLQTLTHKGCQRVFQNKVDYRSIMHKLLMEMNILQNENSPVSL